MGWPGFLPLPAAASFAEGYGDGKKILPHQRFSHAARIPVRVVSRRSGQRHHARGHRHPRTARNRAARRLSARSGALRLHRGVHRLCDLRVQSVYLGRRGLDDRADLCGHADGARCDADDALRAARELSRAGRRVGVDCRGDCEGGMDCGLAFDSSDRWVPGRDFGSHHRRPTSGAPRRWRWKRGADLPLLARGARTRLDQRVGSRRWSERSGNYARGVEDQQAHTGGAHRDRRRGARGRGVCVRAAWGGDARRTAGAIADVSGADGAQRDGPRGTCAAHTRGCGGVHHADGGGRGGQAACCPD